MDFFIVLGYVSGIMFSGLSIVVGVMLMAGALEDDCVSRATQAFFLGLCLLILGTTGAITIARSGRPAPPDTTQVEKAP